MKTRTCWAMLSLAAICIFHPASARGAVSFSAGIQIGTVSDFYDPLTPYGAWVQVGSYGRCWHPTVQLDTGWRPYGVGHWEWTDCGWYWVSDEPWAWACYHYGSWVLDPSYGWVWVPGTEWAPAWVVWRESPDYDYIGWAPCGPSGIAVSPSWFCFVDAHHFHDRIYPGALIVNDSRLFQRTREISGIRRESRDFNGRRERVVVNAGPPVDRLQRVTGQTFRAQPVRDVVRSTPLPQPILQRAEPWRRENARVIEGGAATRERNRSVQPSAQTPSERQRIQERSGAQSAPTTREERNLTPSGREQPRTYQQPSTQTAPKAPIPSAREERNITPSGREQPRVQEPPTTVKPAQPLPSTREERSVTPSGREQPRVYQHPSTTPVTPSRPAVPESRSHEQVTPSRPRTPAVPERTLPPTGREERKFEQPPRATPTPPRAEPARPEHPETPARPVERPAQAEHGRDKDKDHP